MLSEAELRAHLARLLIENGCTWTADGRHGPTRLVEVASATAVIARWITQQQNQPITKEEA